jgi:hypothetical protein
MNNELVQQIQDARIGLEPSFKSLRAALAALKAAERLAGEEKLDALAMQKANTKLQAALAGLDDAGFRAAADTFSAETHKALDALAFEFASDLRDVFEARGLHVEGRPPTLVVGKLVLQIDIGVRKAQWFYGKEALTRPIPLSINAILKAHDRQHKQIIARTLDDPQAFLRELYSAWESALAKRNKSPQGKRINIVEIFSEVTLNRQSSRFWNSPSRKTFKDYERAHFVRDLVLLQQHSRQLTANGNEYQLRLGTATKSQADNAMRSVWLPTSALDGNYYSDLTFL